MSTRLPAVCLSSCWSKRGERAHRVPFIRLNHNTGCSAAMSSGTQYMLQKNPCTHTCPLLTFGILMNRHGVRNILPPQQQKKFVKRRLLLRNTAARDTFCWWNTRLCEVKAGGEVGRVDLFTERSWWALLRDLSLTFAARATLHSQNESGIGGIKKVQNGWLLTGKLFIAARLEGLTFSD